MKIGSTVLVYWLLTAPTVKSFAPSNFNNNGCRRGLNYRTADHHKPMGNYMNLEHFNGSSDCDGPIIDVQASLVAPNLDTTNESNYHQHQQLQIQNSEPRVVYVEAECVDSHMPSGVNKLREIAEAEGYDTTDMGQEELEQIARWAQSQNFQQEKHEANRDKTVKTKYSSISTEELQTVALDEGYDPRGMGRDELEKIMEWVHSQKYQEQKQNSHQNRTVKTRYSSVPTRELQTVALAEGYDINGVGRDDLEKIAEWVHSQEYKQQKQKSQAKAPVNTRYASTSIEDLQANARTEGYDITGLERNGLEKIAEWVHSQEYKQQKENSQVKAPAATSKYASTSVEDLRGFARAEGYDIIGLERNGLEKIAEWVHSQEYKQQKENSQVKALATSKYASTSVEDLRGFARAEGYDINGVERNDLEKIAEWVHSQEYKENKQKSHAKAAAQKIQNQSRFASSSFDELRAMAHDKGYDTTGLERTDLEKIAEWVRTMPHQPTGNQGNDAYASRTFIPKPFKSDADVFNQSGAKQNQPSFFNSAHNTRQEDLQQQNPQDQQQQEHPFFVEVVEEKIHSNQQQLHQHQEHLQQQNNQHPHYVKDIEENLYSNQQQTHQHQEHNRPPPQHSQHVQQQNHHNRPPPQHSQHGRQQNHHNRGPQNPQPHHSQYVQQQNYHNRPQNPQQQYPNPNQNQRHQQHPHQQVPQGTRSTSFVHPSEAFKSDADVAAEQLETARLRYDEEQRLVDANSVFPKVVTSHFESMQGAWNI
jgi:hypothetical protein